MKTPSKGFVIVASKSKTFYQLAINLAESILDYDPEAKVTLFTEDQFKDSRADFLDNVFSCSSHYRAKLYGMANSPYDITMYLDADMEVIHEDISTVFDQLGDNDMVFTPLRKSEEYAFKNRYFNEEDPQDYYAMKLNGGVCLYDNRKQIVKDFMNDWWEYYQKQTTNSDDPENTVSSGTWWPTKENGEWDLDTYPRDRGLWCWDQFTLWWLTNEEEKYKDLKIGTFDDWPRWNWYQTFMKTRTPVNKPIVILHHSGIDRKWKSHYGTEQDIQS